MTEVISVRIFAPPTIDRLSPQTQASARGGRSTFRGTHLCGRFDVGDAPRATRFCIAAKYRDVPQRTRGDCIGISAGGRSELLLRLGLFVIGNADRLEVVGCIKLGAVATPCGGFKYTVYLAETAGWKPQRHDLSNSHHDVPTDDLNSSGGKAL